MIASHRRNLEGEMLQFGPLSYSKLPRCFLGLCVYQRSFTKGTPSPVYALPPDSAAVLINNCRQMIICVLVEGRFHLPGVTPTGHFYPPNASIAIIPRILSPAARTIMPETRHRVKHSKQSILNRIPDLKLE